MNTKNLAAIDIGSNAIRLMISSVDNSNNTPIFKRIAFLRVPIRLGEDTFAKGFIDKEKLESLNYALMGFSNMLKAYKVDEYLACATSAMREAKNSKEIVKSIQKNTGIKINVITGLLEAEIIYSAGGLNSVIDPNMNYLYVDVGGGSTEVVLYSNNKVVESKSFQIGTVRSLAKRVKEEELDAFKKWLTQIYKKNGPIAIIASGGNINKIHKLLRKGSKEPITYTELQLFHESLSDMTYEERMANLSLNNYRADVIIPAMEIFLIVGKRCKVNEFYVPKVGVVDGIIRLLNSKQNGSKLATKVLAQIK